MSICSTLTRKLSIRHPFRPVMCREDGAILTRVQGGKRTFRYTFGRLSTKGYMRLQIGKETLAVHRLIAEAFIPNTMNLPTVDHINRCRQDNRPCNLRWADYEMQASNRKVRCDRKI